MYPNWSITLYIGSEFEVSSSKRMNKMQQQPASWNKLPAIQHKNNIVDDGVIPLSDIVHKTCHYSWPG